MKFNNKELIEIYCMPSDLEGRLQHKRAHKSGYKERWFKLKYNFLFYHNINEVGQIETLQPAGVIILENFNVKSDLINEGSFAFGIIFQNQPHKWHILSGRSEILIEKWVTAINQASYEFWRSKLLSLQKVLSEKTGKDPLLMYPRNKGVIKKEAWEYNLNFVSHVKSFEVNLLNNSHPSEKSDLIDL